MRLLSVCGQLIPCGLPTSQERRTKTRLKKRKLFPVVSILLRRESRKATSATRWRFIGNLSRLRPGWTRRKTFVLLQRPSRYAHFITKDVMVQYITGGSRGGVASLGANPGVSLRDIFRQPDDEWEQSTRRRRY